MLTDPECRNATCPPGKRHARFFDSGGLYLEVAAHGSKRWFWKFYFAGKERRMALGNYPEVTLKLARLARDEARQVRVAGTDPVQARKLAKVTARLSAATSFEAVARDFHAHKAAGWSEGHAAQWLRAVEKDLFPWIGALPIADVSAPALLATLRRVEARGAVYTARALREYAAQVFRFGIATSRCARNPAADLTDALRAHVPGHFAAVIEPKAAGALLRDIDGYIGHPVTRAALALAALLFQRPFNIRAMEWSWIDEDAAMLTIPASAMKRRKAGKINGRPHLVPLARQALAILAELRPLTGSGTYVFPAVTSRDRPQSENTMRAALRRMGYENDDHTVHGFRAMAETMLREKLHFKPDVIEAQMAHVKSGPLGSAYDRAEYLDQRHELMQAWADYLDKLRAGAEVIDIRRA